MTNRGLYSSKGAASPPYTTGPYFWDQSVTFTGGANGVNVIGDAWYVDGTNGSDTFDGMSWKSPKATIQAAVTAAGKNDIVFVLAQEMASGATDPVSYTENVVIAATKANLSLVGVSRGRTQGGLPQLKTGAATTTALITVRAPGCLIANMGINGDGCTGGGILLDDNGSTKTAFGTTITGCHFKNCVGSSATDATTGGAIQWSSAGNAWQVFIVGNRFYKNISDITLLGTSGSVPQDVVIEDNVFSGPAASVDCNVYLAGGSGMNGVIIRRNTFPCMPSAGAINMPVKLTGCVGVLSENTFGTTGKTYGAAANILVPTTMLMAANWQESGTTFIART